MSERTDARKKLCWEGENRAAGFAMVIPLIFTAVFIIIAAGSALSVLNYHRSLVTAAEQGQVNETAVALMAKAAENLSDQVQANDAFPGLNNLAAIESATAEWFSNSSQAYFNTNFDTFLRGLGLPQTPSNYFAGYVRGTHYDLEITIEGAPPTSDSVETKYNIAAWVKGQNTEAYANFGQAITIRKGQLFNYFAFYDLPLEIASGPDLTLRGPIFSNSNIYVMPSENHKIEFTGFSPPPGGDITHVPFLLQTPQTIWFYFMRFVGELYNPNPVPFNMTLENFRQAMFNRGQCQTSTCSGSDEGIERSSGGRPVYYYPSLNVSLKSSGSTSGNEWFVDGNSGSPVAVSPPHPTAESYTGKYLSPANLKVNLTNIYFPDLINTDLRGSAAMSTNPAWANFVNTQFKYTGGSADNYVLGDAASTSGAIAEKTVSVGIPGNQDNKNHVLIEPICLGEDGTWAGYHDCRDEDSPTTVKAKMQFKANINLDYRFKYLFSDHGGQPHVLDPNCYDGVENDGYCTTDSSYTEPSFLACSFGGTDLRCNPAQNDGQQSKVAFNMCTIDVAQLMADIAAGRVKDADANKRDDLGYLKPGYSETILTEADPIIVFFNSDYCMAGGGVRLVNAAKLPKNGFTFATPLRVQIKAAEGDEQDGGAGLFGYNIYHYDKDGQGNSLDTGHYCEVCKIEDGCTLGDELVYQDGGVWHECVPPPASIFSDSVVVLSNDFEDWPDPNWKKPDGSTYNRSHFQNHRVQADETMIIAAIVTGHIPSTLKAYSDHTQAIGEFGIYGGNSCTRGWGQPNQTQSGSWGLSDLVSYDQQGNQFHYITADGANGVDGLKFDIVTDTDTTGETLPRPSGCNRDQPVTIDECNNIVVQGVDLAADGVTPFVSTYDNNGNGVVTLNELPGGSGCNDGSSLKIPVLLKINKEGKVIWQPINTIPGARGIHRGSRFAYLCYSKLYGYSNIAVDSPGSYSCNSCTGGICGGDCTQTIPDYSPPTSGVYSCSVESPVLQYYAASYPIYYTKYSGGLINLIEQMEDWREYNHYEIGNQGTGICPNVDARGCIPILTGNARKLYLKGTLSSLWRSIANLDFKGAYSPCYWTPNSYAAPERYFLYNKHLVDDPPPGAPAVNEVVLGEFEEGGQPSP